MANSDVEKNNEATKNIDDKNKEYDPWDVVDIKVNEVPWGELTTEGKVKRVLFYVGRFILLFGLLYLFICSLDFLSSAFRLLGGKSAGKVFREDDLLTNPIAGLMMGVLVTVLVQSSSTSTSIVITMVGAGIIPPEDAVYLIMGANIGTTVTNTIVSLAHAGRKDEFRRAFGGATVHDMFNWLTVAIFLPLEVASGMFFKFTEWIVKRWELKQDEDANKEFLKKLTNPFTKLVIQVDKKVITKIAKGEEGAEDLPILKTTCKSDDPIDIITELKNVTLDNGTVVEQNVTEEIYDKFTCKALFSQFDLGDTAAGVIILIVALVILCTCLILIVKLLHSLLKGKIALIIKKFVSAEYSGPTSYLMGYVAIILGTGLTILVQSSSIFTSALTPLVGVGVIKLETMFPLTLGSNIGTTFTGVLAALTQDENLDIAMQIALVHLFFNICGILVWYPIPIIRQVPIVLAKKLGDTTADYRWFAIVYLFIVFFIVPAAVFGLSVAGWVVLVAVGGPILLIFLATVVINILQVKCPHAIVCVGLRNWDFLPWWMHSLDPLDRLLRKIFRCGCCQRLFCDQIAEDDMPVEIHVNGTANGHVTSGGVTNPGYEKSNLDISNQTRM